MRTDPERELQNALAAQNRNPAFSTPRDEILKMLPPAERRYAMMIGFSSDTRFNSPLYRRVFADSRGPVAAINDIRDLIEPLPEQQRYQAIKDWVSQ